MKLIVSFMSSPSPSVRRIVPLPYLGCLTRVPRVHFPADFFPGTGLGFAADRQSLHHGIHRVVGGAAIRRGRLAPTFAGFLDEFRGNLRQKTRRLRNLLIHIAEVAPESRGSEIELLLGAGHADIKQPALFLQLAAFLHGPAVRKQAIFQSHDEHDGKLQSLGGVERHQVIGASRRRHPDRTPAPHDRENPAVSRRVPGSPPPPSAVRECFRSGFPLLRFPPPAASPHTSTN